MKIINKLNNKISQEQSEVKLERLVMQKKLKACDNCTEEWGEGFFCEKCSDQMCVREAGFDLTEEISSTGNVCMNCCTCWLE